MARLGEAPPVVVGKETIIIVIIIFILFLVVIAIALSLVGALLFW